MPVGDDVTIPESVRVRCPIKAFALRRASLCDGCPHFAGLAEQLGNERLPFHRRYTVRCAHPIERELAATVED